MPRDAEPGYPCFAGPGDRKPRRPGRPVTRLEPSMLPDGFGRSLPRKADIVVQVHYHPSGKPEIDRTQIGLYFAKKPVKRTVHRARLQSPSSCCPPAAPMRPTSRSRHRGRCRLT